MHDRTRHAALVLAAVFCAFGAGELAAAQQYPTRIIRVVNPNQPGGNSDVLFRLLSPKMGEIMGQQLVVDYRPGAGGNIGAEMVSKAAPDGYTTLIAAASFLINPSLLKNLPFDAVRDFTPLGLIVDIPAVLVTHPSLPVKNVKELVALAKKRPGELNFSSSGRGAVGHLSGALFNSTMGIDIVQGRGPGHRRSRRRPRAAFVRQHSRRRRSRAERTAAHARTMRRDALSVVSRLAHHAGVWRAALRGEQWFQLPRAGEDAATGRRQTQQRAGADLARSRDQQNADRTRRSADRQHAGRTRRIHQIRNREVAEGREQRRAQARIMRRITPEAPAFR